MNQQQAGSGKSSKSSKAAKAGKPGNGGGNGSGNGDGDGDGELVKVGFVDDDGDVETLWARCIGPNAYRIDNVPFFQDGLSMLDVVEAVADGNGMPYFTRVLRKSGHRTVRVLLEDPCDDEDPFYSRLVQLGCGVARATPRFLALDIPPNADIEAIARHLATSDVDWEPSDPCCPAESEGDA